MTTTECYTLAHGFCADIHRRERETTCEIWTGFDTRTNREPRHLCTGLTTRNPRDVDNEAIAVTTALARALMLFYGRPSLFVHLDAIHDQMLTREYRMLLRQIAEEARKRKQ